MKILFIEPSKYNPDGSLRKQRQAMVPSITLPLLAALTPAEFEVSIVNEAIEPLDTGAAADIAAITCFTTSAGRAYEIADAFRRRGVYVVMGGVHVTVLPQEALEHADTVITGEAERLWPEFLSDFRNGVRKRLYSSGDRPSLAGLPVPRFDLVRKEGYFSLSGRGVLGRIIPTPVYPVQTARGCPHKCSFCAVSVLCGATYRPRPVEEVTAEIRSLGVKGCFFTDDNIFADRQRARRLFTALLPLGIFWVAQGTISAGDDPELLDLAYRSGCREVLTGIETISEENIRDIGKAPNRVGDYARQIAAYNASGIGMTATMMFGFENDGPGVFRSTYEFLTRHRVPYSLWRPVVPFPGTAYYAEALRSGRLKLDKWWLMPPGSVRKHEITSGRIPPDEFERGYLKYSRKLYSLGSIVRRNLLPPHKGSFVQFALNLLMWLAKTGGYADPISNFLYRAGEKAAPSEAR